MLRLVMARQQIDRVMVFEATSNPLTREVTSNNFSDRQNSLLYCQESTNILLDTVKKRGEQ
jgi:hypothetical protein